MCLCGKWIYNAGEEGKATLQLKKKKKKRASYIRIQPWVNSSAMFSLVQCHGTGNHITASDWEEVELNLDSSAWKSSVEEGAPEL